MLSISVAVSKNNVIGKGNRLVWHVPEDLKRFKKLTIGHNIIMGRKTFESLGRVLPNRHHIVIAKNFTYDDPNVEVLEDINQLKKYIDDENENFVIGGESIYKQLLPYTQKIYLTKINVEVEGDAYFPEINENEWKIIARELSEISLAEIVQYITYQRI